MTVRADGPVEFNGEPANSLHVALGGEPSAGFMPQVVVIEAVKTVDGIRLPVVLRERTGDTYGSLTTFTTIVTGDAAMRELVGDE